MRRIITGLAAGLGGTVVMTLAMEASYQGRVPAMGLLPPASRWPRERNALMIAAHLVWGSTLAALAEWAEQSSPASAYHDV
jgi:hypothetical protein